MPTKSKVKKIALGSRTIAAAATVPDNFPALLALSHAIFSDFIAGETTQTARRAVSEALNETIMPTLELSIRLKAASGLSLRDFLGADSEEVSQTLEDKLASHLDSALSGESKMNVPAAKLLLNSVQQRKQQEHDNYTAAVLNDPTVQQAIAEKLHQIKQQENQ